MMRIALCLLLLSMNVAAAPDIQHWQTNKGVDVYLVETHVLPMVDIEVVFDAGSVRDPDDKRGLANLVSSLLGQAAAGMTADEISFEFERLGAQFGSRGGYDTASVSLRSLSEPEQLQPALDNLRKVLTRPEFPQDVLERERNRFLVAIQRKQQSPQEIAQEQFFKSIYQSHPYAYPNEGTPESLKNISRGDLAEFHQQYYTTGNAMVSLVGDIDRRRAEIIAEAITNELPTGPAPAGFPEVQQLESGVSLGIYHPSTQVHILMGQPGMKYGDPDYFPLYVGNHILGGGGLVSRLFEEVREKRGLSYGASSYFAPRRGLGPFLASSATRDDQTDEALEVMKQTISDFIKNGPAPEELEASKKNITGGFPLRIDSNSKILGYLSVIGFYGLPMDYLDRFNEQVQAVTVEQIREAFQRRVDVDDFAVITVGPVQDTSE